MEVLQHRSRQWREWAAGKWLTSYRLNALRTAAYGLTHRRGPSQLTLILGCQRSGTTMLASAIGLSPQVKCCGEGDAEYFRWDGAPRLLPLEEVANRLSRERSPFTLLKPLCESQRAIEILERFPSGKAVWIVRNFRECVASHVRYYRQFHDGLAYVREMLNLEAPCWKNENLSAGVRELLASFANRPLNLETAYALYWLARNSLFETIPERAPVSLVNYEDILASPTQSLHAVFEHLSIPFKAKYARIVKEPLRTGSINLPNAIDEDVAEYCEQLGQRLRSRALPASIGSRCEASSKPHMANGIKLRQPIPGPSTPQRI